MRMVRSAKSRKSSQDSARARQTNLKSASGRPGTAKSGGRPGTPKTPSRPKTAEWRNGQLVDEDGNAYFPVTSRKRFKRSLRRIWYTQLTENVPAEDREQTLKTTLRELFIYLVFVILLCIVGFCMLDPVMYYFTKVMKGLFVDDPNFEGISKHEEFFNYAMGPLLNGLYWEQYYDGADVKNKEHHFIYFENKLIGVPRIRQVRIKRNTCTLASTFKNFIDDCIGSFDQSLEDKESYGLKNGSAWNYQESDVMNSSSVKGRFSDYGGGGFAQLLGPDKFQSQKKLAKLKENLWLDRQTRALFIEFSVYNANINMFCIITLILEYTPTGAAVPYFHFNTLKLLRYVSTQDYFVMACEGILVIYLIYYIIEEVLEFKAHRWEYFKFFWNYVDIGVICLVFGTIIFNLYRTFEVSTKLKLILDGYDTLYANFGVLSGWQQTYNDIVAVTLFIAWLKVFKYISFNQTLMELQNTLSTCALDMAAFSVMFFIMFLAYAQWGYLIFGYMVFDFKTYFDAVFALFRVILGDFDFLALEEANRSMGPVFFISYIFVIFFIILNMFLAILFDTYAEVKEEMTELYEGAVGVGDLFNQGVDNLMSKLTKKKERINDLQDAMKDADADRDDKIDFNEFFEELSSRGYKEQEIRDLFHRYDKNCDGILDQDDQEAMRMDLQDQEDDVVQEILEAKQAKAEAAKMGSSSSLNSTGSEEEEEEEKVVKPEEMEELSERIEKSEEDVGELIQRIDAAIAQLESMDKTVLPGREAMGKILDSIYRKSSLVNLKGGGLAKRMSKMSLISRPDSGASQRSESSIGSQESLRDD